METLRAARMAWTRSQMARMTRPPRSRPLSRQTPLLSPPPRPIKPNHSPQPSWPPTSRPLCCQTPPHEKSKDSHPPPPSRPPSRPPSTPPSVTSTPVLHWSPPHQTKPPHRRSLPLPTRPRPPNPKWVLSRSLTPCDPSWQPTHLPTVSHAQPTLHSSPTASTPKTPCPKRFLPVGSPPPLERSAPTRSSGASWRRSSFGRGKRSLRAARASALARSTTASAGTRITGSRVGPKFTFGT
mmetsp:Transcript_23071/g.55249  ORF Transcript_23071/g.55249 Transcript_23071/m.55249 type:complete len:239 (+) Transcript_23071:101-817(+)